MNTPINRASSEEINRLLFKKNRSTATPLNLVAETRFIGTKDVGQGMPFGTAVGADGQPRLEKIALMRIQPDEHIAEAHRIVKVHNIKKLLLGSLLGIAFGLLSVFVLHNIQSRHSLPEYVAAPCVVIGLSQTDVVCASERGNVVVGVKQAFPGNLYTLESVYPNQRMFVVSSNGKNQTIQFQVAPQPHFNQGEAP